ncbi:MAG: outer membrane lipoprotein-sorting protein [Pseudomonadota bacterium]|nr:outer membrane lipoprotein-sorting protein [Pseudomonadota bacterium]
MDKQLWIIVGFVVAFLGTGFAHSADISAEAILLQADRARGAQLPGIEWTIQVLAREDGDERRREILVRAKDDNSLVRFLSPAKVRGQKMLLVGQNMWFIRDGLQKPVPISPRQRLIGEASNGDIASTNYSGNYRPEILREEAIDGQPCYVLELKAANRWVTYDRIVYWVTKNRLVGVRADFHTLSGKLFKSATFEYDNLIHYQGKALPFVSRMVIRDAISPGNVTTLDYGKIQVKSLTAKDFNVDLLMRE